MISFEVTDMTCGRCSSRIRQAVQAVDDGAQVQFDLTTQRVDIEATRAGGGPLQAAIEQAGYTPRLLAVAADAKGSDAAAQVPRSGCCCR